MSLSNWVVIIFTLSLAKIWLISHMQLNVKHNSIHVTKNKIKYNNSELSPIIMVQINVLTFCMKQFVCGTMIIIYYHYNCFNFSSLFYLIKRFPINQANYQYKHKINRHVSHNYKGLRLNIDPRALNLHTDHIKQPNSICIS